MDFAKSLTKNSNKFNTNTMIRTSKTLENMF